MDWQGALRARLIADASVTALVAQRVTWIDRPQGSILPAITLQTISERREQHLKGFQGYDAARVQMDVWAASYGSARQVADAALAAAVPAALSNGIQFSRAMVESLRDLSESTATSTIYRVSVDLIIHHAAA